MSTSATPPSDDAEPDAQTPVHQPAPSGGTPPNGWGQPPAGQPTGYGPPPGTPPAPGQPGYGQPAYGQPVYGQPAYGQPVYGQPAYGGPVPGALPYAGPAKPGIVPLRPLTLGEIFDGSFGAVRHNPGAVLGLSSLIVVAATAVGALLGYLVAGYLAELLASNEFTDAMAQEGFGTDVDGLALLYSTSVGASLVFWIASPFVTAVVAVSLSRSVIGDKISVAAVWKSAARRGWLLLGWAILFGTAQMLLVGLYVGLIVLIAQSSGGGATAFGILGGLGLAVLFVWLAVRVLLVPAGLALESGRFGKTIARAWRLTRGSFWRTLGIYLLAAIAIAIIGGILQYPFGIVAALAMSGGSLAIGLIISTVGGAIISVLQTVFLGAVVSLQYIDLRIRREGLDIELTAAAARVDAAR